MKSKTGLWFVLILALVGAVFYPMLETFFSQDDFFHFVLAQQNGGLKALWDFRDFGERGVAFYRPISREWLYGGYYNLFGLESAPFRVLAMGVQFLNIGLVFWLFKRWYNSTVGLLASLFFGLSASNVAILYYLAGGIQAQLAVCFSLLAVLALDKFLTTGVWKWWGWGFGSWLVAMGCHEMAVVVPVIFGLLWLMNRRQISFKAMILASLPFAGLVIGLILAEVKGIGYSSQDQQYHLNLNPKRAVNTLVWYFGWSIGLPEMLIDFVESGLKLNPVLMRYWGQYYQFIFPAFGLVLVSLVGLVGLAGKKLILDRKIWLLVIWFPLALLTVLFLPEHKSSYYLAMSNVAMAGILAVSCGLVWQRKTKIGRLMTNILVISFVVLSVASSRLGLDTYWAASRGRLAESVIQQVVQKYPSVSASDVIYLQNDPNYPFVIEDWGGTSKQAAVAINRGDGLRLYYHQPKLQVYFEDLGGLPAGIKPEQVKALTIYLKQ